MSWKQKIVTTMEQYYQEELEFLHNKVCPCLPVVSTQYSRRNLTIPKQNSLSTQCQDNVRTYITKSNKWETERLHFIS
jgi:hypothetical protein